jgi:hypothetical protein
LTRPWIHETRAIERDLADARRLGALGDGAADGLGRLDVAGALEVLATASCTVEAAASTLAPAVESNTCA